ncbi:MAG: thymidine phosphorylase [candidate division WOR-3 bacterium]|nr:thymidine phosphorylase [candidate division WOR-3 bacterium]
MVDLIRKKRDGKVLSKSEIEKFVRGVKNGVIPDYQISALLMAIYFKGMNLEETANLTYFMLNSGETFDLSEIPGYKIDKHSTGGVGDNISLILTPLAAEMGIFVPMISGRSLGHTGGTIDKLESIPGYNSSLEFDQFKDILKKVRCSIISQTEKIAPVDKELYALRDVTATVESIPLITSSILSKKLSEDLDGLVIDLKVGKGAFMKDLDSAKRLGEMMEKVGEKLGTEMKIVFTDQSSPLGRSIGNSPEVIEAIEILKGNFVEDTLEVTIALVEEMCKMAGVEGNVKGVLKSRAAYERFKKMVKLHGGDLSKLSTYSNPYEVKSLKDGIVQEIDAYKVGIASLYTGAGRKSKVDKVDPKAGIKLLKVEGEEVKRGDVIALIYTEKPFKPIKEMILSAYTLGCEEKKPQSKIIEKW